MMEEFRNEEIKSLAGASPEELAKAIAEILDNKKAKDVKIIAVGDKTIIADYFVLANGNTSTQVRALADEVEYKLGLAGVDPATRDYIMSVIINNYNPDASVLISTHLISDIEQVLDEVIFIQNGQITLQKAVDEIRAENGKSVDELFREVFKW